MRRMAALPIAARELLVLARQRITYRARVTVAVVTFLFGGGFSVLLTMGGGIRGNAMFLQSLAMYMMIYCMVAGAQATSDSISTEKRGGTLGLLFLTHLRSFDIVFGKLVASTVLAFFGLMASFPILSLVLLQGGVQGMDVVRLALGALNTLFVSASVGLVASCVSNDRKRAKSLATLILLFFWIGLPALAAYFQYKHFPSWTYVPLGYISIRQTLQNAISAGTRFVIPPFWLPLFCTHLIGWLFIALATFLLPRNWQEGSASIRVLSWRERWRQWCYGKAERRQHYRSRLLNRNPFFWLAARDRLQPLWTVIPFLIIFGAFIWALIGAKLVSEPTIYVVFFIMTALVLIIGTGNSASSRLIEEHEQGTLELLLCTPLNVSEIVRGQFRACWRHFGAIYVSYFLLGGALLGVVLLVNVLNIRAAWPRPALFHLLMVGAAWLAIFPLLLVAMVYLGMWSVLITQNFKQAAGAATGRGLVVPLSVWVVSFFSLAAISGVTRNNFDPGPWILWGMFFGLFVANSLFWIFRVRRQFESRLREFALERYTPQQKQGVFGWIFKRFSRWKPSAGAPPLLQPQ